MRALLCLALVSTTVFASPTFSRGDATELKQDIEGDYLLDNGRQVRLSLIDNRLYLDLNDIIRRELLPVADRTLASQDGRLRVEYMPDGPVGRIHIQYSGLAGERIGERRWRGR